jgi:asparagine synthase (glutamine-hydrolysing)
MLEALSHRGPDGLEILILDSVGFGVQNFVAVPEEVGREQPLSDPSRSVLIAFDGRLDNRQELLGPTEKALEHPVSDAQLVLAAYLRQGTNCFRRLLGPFALVLFDSRTRRIFCARDAMGDRTLFYHSTPELLLLGSEEGAILQHPEVSSELNRGHLARFFALRPPVGGSNFFRGISELEPGCLLEVGEEATRIERFWSPEEVRTVRFRRDEEYAEAFREQLGRAVRTRLRSVEPVAVMMSGGLDSTSLAALAQRADPAAPIFCVSWVFDEAITCDERPFIESIVERLGLASLQFVGDSYWPLFDQRSFTANRNTPEENPYRGLKQEAYRKAAEAGCRVILNGGSADVLYTGSRGWLNDLLRERRVVDAARGLAREAQRRGLRAVGRSLLALARGSDSGITRRRASSPATWLTDSSRRLLVGEGDLADDGGNSDRALGWFRQHSSRQARGVTVEIFHANREGVELRHPYRDRRLVEFMLGIPAHQLYQEGRHKPIARRAMRTLLPRVILERSAPTSLTPFFQTALRQSAASTVDRILFADDVSWQEHVRPEFIRGLLKSTEWRPIDGVVLWNCLSFELWRRW